MFVAAVSGDVFNNARLVTSDRRGRTVQTVADKCATAADVGKTYCGSDTVPYCDAVQAFVRIKLV